MRDTKVHHLINNDTKQDSLGIVESTLSTNMMSIVLLKTVYLGPLWTLYNRIQSNNYTVWTRFCVIIDYAYMVLS